MLQVPGVRLRGPALPGHEADPGLWSRPRQAGFTRRSGETKPRIVHLEYYSEADPYVLIKCEGKRFKSEPVKNNQNPVWNFSVLLYR